MEPKYNMPNRNPRLPPSTPRKRNSSKNYAASSSSVDSTVLTTISAIALQSANSTKETLAHTNQLLDYLATQEDAVLTYNRSEMIMAVHSDASYL
jgi:hypothetical protein